MTYRPGRIKRIVDIDLPRRSAVVYRGLHGWLEEGLRRLFCVNDADQGGEVFCALVANLAGPCSLGFAIQVLILNVTGSAVRGVVCARGMLPK
jgi:hypothetical protein